MLFDNALSALTIVLDPARFAIVFAGICLGLVIGILPGIGGLGGMALLIPFTHAMDTHTALAFLIGMWAVTATSDTVPAILFGVPGAIGSAATVLDGHPMAKRGEAGRAFGASFSSSIVGGLIGAVLLAVSIPILRPFMLAIGTPELLAVCVLGLTLVASVSQGAILKGLIVAVFGVLLAAVGEEAQSGQLRWTFDGLLRHLSVRRRADRMHRARPVRGSGTLGHGDRAHQYGLRRSGCPACSASRCAACAT